MEKDFDRWNEQKKAVHGRDREVLFHEREIWWCSLGLNVGSEQDGASGGFERPVLVVKNFNGRVLWALPLTRTAKKGKHYYRLDEDPQHSAVVLSQLRLISSKRLVRKIRTIDSPEFKEVVRAVIRLFPGA